MKNVKSFIATAIIILSISCSNSQNFKSVEVAEFKSTLEKQTMRNLSTCEQQENTLADTSIIQQT